MQSLRGLRRLGADLEEVERVPLVSDPLTPGGGQGPAPMPAWSVTSGFITTRNGADMLDTVEFWTP
jgi:hypothetical protein